MCNYVLYKKQAMYINSIKTEPYELMKIKTTNKSIFLLIINENNQEWLET
jgi:hypothetical protein